MSDERAAEFQVLGLFPASAAPPFDDAAALLRDWNADWGCDDDVSALRTVLVRRPGDEWNGVRADCWDEAARALVDPDRNWFWESRELPRVARMGNEHDGLVAALPAEGVDVDRDKALCDVHRLPYWFADRLRDSASS
ncbi:MAG: hypothetical protein QOE87_2951 [Gaiellales bacterium]|nr:hypothetical protein [Gaiellales bacterium]